jgi:hypothetical protein
VFTGTVAGAGAAVVTGTVAGDGAGRVQPDASTRASMRRTGRSRGPGFIAICLDHHPFIRMLKKKLEFFTTGNSRHNNFRAYKTVLKKYEVKKIPGKKFQSLKFFDKIFLSPKISGNFFSRPKMFQLKKSGL